MSKNLTKRDIVLDIYDKTDFPQKEVRETVQLTLDAIANAPCKKGGEGSSPVEPVKITKVEIQRG